jgi:hypothetical protein
MDVNGVLDAWHIGRVLDRILKSPAGDVRGQVTSLGRIELRARRGL